MGLIYRELEPDLRATQPSVCANKTCPSGNSATCAWFLLSFFFCFFVFLFFIPSKIYNQCPLFYTIQIHSVAAAYKQRLSSIVLEVHVSIKERLESGLVFSLEPGFTSSFRASRISKEGGYTSRMPTICRTCYIILEPTGQLYSK